VASTGSSDTPSTRPDDDDDGNGQPSAWDLLGGEPVVRRITDRFYDLMDADPDFFAIRKLHPDDLSGSREKLFLFLCGWLGGPQYYIEKHGHPMLRARHLPFVVDTAARDAWMACMALALAEVVPDAGLRAPLQGALDRLATHMINQG
jgi:hemoglobin